MIPVVRSTKQGSVTRTHLVVVAPTPLVGQELHRSTKLHYHFIPLIKTTLQRLDFLFQEVMTTFEVGDLLPLMGQATPNGIQLGGGLLEATIYMFIKLEDQLIKVGDVQGPFNLQIVKAIFKS